MSRTTGNVEYCVMCDRYYCESCEPCACTPDDLGSEFEDEKEPTDESK